MESAKDTGKNVVSKARDALERMLKFDYATHEKGVTNFHYDWHKQDEKVLNELVTRDEPKHVVREHHLRAWGTCPVCKVNVGLPFHIKFCGACGNRIVWEGEKK